MNNLRHFFTIVTMFAAFSALLVPRARADDDRKSVSERELIEILLSDAPAAEKAITCKRLAIYGTGDAVPVLAPLLNDERLASWARIALEAIPGAAADEALRQAIRTQRGGLLIGAINSSGVRRDAGAVELLAARLDEPDVAVASAAAVALGQIGNAPAIEILRQSLTGVPVAVRSAVAEGMIVSAERLLGDARAGEAVALYDEVRRADVSKQRVLEATRGAILARETGGTSLLVEQLRSPDPGFFHIGLSTAREMAGSEVTQALAAEVTGAAADRAALLLHALADRGDATALPVVLQFAKEGPKQVRIVAIGVLPRLGAATCLPDLLDLAVKGDADVADAATTALANLSGTTVNPELAARLPAARDRELQVLIELVGRRRIDATTFLRQAADHPDGTTRRAALAALGATVELEELTELIVRVAAPKFPEDLEAARQALQTACIRMPDREECAEKLAAAMPQAPVSAQCDFLDILAAMGGTRALKVLGAAANSANPDLQDTASRLLGRWMTLDAAPVLLELARDASDDKLQVRAVRGYLRLARQFAMPDRQRAEMCGRALDVARRPAEQQLILEVLERYPSVDTLQRAVQAMQVSGLTEDAARTAQDIVQELCGRTIDARELLAEMGPEPVHVEIIKATYGTDANHKDVTDQLRQHVRDWPLIALPSKSYNSIFGGDPAPGIEKRLRVDYRINGRVGEMSFPEDGIVVLPVPE